jgi:hypothetical protein
MIVRLLVLSILAGMVSTTAFVIVAFVATAAAVSGLGTVIGSVAVVDLLATFALKARLHR